MTHENSSSQLRCPSCGAVVELDDSACRYCGAGLPTAETVPTPAPTNGAASFATGLPTGTAGALTDELRESLAPGIQLLRLLGEGGMGLVWLARDPMLKRLVAVKVMHPELANDPASRARFEREASAAAAVAHPGVVNVYHVGELPRSGTAYFVMQYVDGQSLQEEITPGQAMPEPRARRIVGEIASALAAAHARGLVHRDIKPANIMIDRESGRVVVLDFGISAALERRSVPGAERLTAEGHSIGTPMYMSPEQAAAKDVTPKSDVYSLGVVAFELTTGHPPFTGATPMELVAAHLKDAPPKTSSLRPDLTAEFADLIDRCLEKNPERRPVAADLARSLLPSAQPLIEWPPPGLEPLRGRGASLVAAFALTVACAVGFLLLLLRQPILMSPLRLNRWFLERGTASPTLVFDGMPIWFFVLVICSGIGLALVPLVAARAWRLATHLRRARRSGYPWPTLLDVAWDFRADTDALLNSTGRFALIGQAERAHLMSLRRSRAAVAVATLVYAVSATVMWAIGWTGGWATGTDILPAPEAGLLLGPVLLGLLGLLWLSRPEARATVRTGRRRLFGWRHGEPAVRPELVNAWLASSGKAAPAGALRESLATLSFAPVLLVLALVAAGSLVFLAAAISANNLVWSRPRALAVLGSLTTDSLRHTPWRDYDSIFALSGHVPGAGSAADLVAARRLLGSSKLRPYWDADTTGRLTKPPPLDSRGWAQFLFGPNPAPIDAVAAKMLASDTLTPMLALWRRLARSAPLPPLWHLRPGLPGLASPLDMTMTVAVLDPTGQNIASGLLALREQDSATALLRARENIAVARQMMRSPVLVDHLVGLRFAEWGRLLIERIGRVMSDPALVAEAERLRVLTLRAKIDLVPWWGGGAQLLMADPADPVLLHYLGDTTLAPVARAEGAVAAVTGFCFNTREILFGADPRRRDLLRRVAAALRQTPRMDDVVLAERRELDEWITSPSSMNTRYLDVLAGIGQWQGPMTRVLAPLGWVGLGGLRDRMLFCMVTSRNRGNWIQ